MRGLLLILLFHTQVLYCQIKLDDDNGIEPFHFEDEFKTWEKDVRETLRISYGQSYYLYEGDLIDIRYNLKVHSTNLGFFKGKLNYIDFYFKTLNDSAFKSFLEMIEEEYGKPEKFLNETDPTIIEAYRWPGEFTLLELVRYNGKPSNWDNRWMTVLRAKKEMD